MIITKGGGTIVKKVWMTSMIKWLVLPMFLVSVVCGMPAATKAEESLNLNVDAAILIDAETGKFYMKRILKQHWV